MTWKEIAYTLKRIIKYVYMHVCICMYLYTHICVYIYIHYPMKEYKMYISTETLGMYRRVDSESVSAKR